MRSRTLAAAVLVALGFAVTTGQRGPEVGGRVFLDAGGLGAPATLDVGLLTDARVRLGAGERPVVRLNVAPGVELVAEVEATGPTSAGYSLTGRLVEGGPGSFTLVVNGDVIAGEVSTPGGHYAIRPAGAGAAVVREIDPAALRPGRDDAVWPAVGPGRREPTTEPIRAPGTVSAPAASDRNPPEDGTRIDVLVLYTEAVKREQGNGTVEGIAAVVDGVIALANRAYFDSGVVQRLHLAAPPRRVAYDEAGRLPEDVLNHLTFRKGDGLDPLGHLDWVHGLRDRTAADVVFLAVHEVVGRGWLGGRDLADFPDYGFATGGFAWPLTLAHELGHVQGLHHDRYELQSSGWDTSGLVHPYAVGFVILGGGRCVPTIMAYPNECVSLGLEFNFHAIRFSNPNRTWEGMPTGGRRHGGLAHAARSLNRTRRAVANWRRAPCLSDGGRVRLQASSGEYVVAVGNGGGAVRADQPRPGPRGRFTLVDHNGGPCVESGDVVSLHTSDGFYLRARGGGGEVDATAPRATPWARFTVGRHLGSGAIRVIDVVTLQTRSGHYVVAEEGGGGPVRADRENAGAWERFRVSR